MQKQTLTAPASPKTQNLYTFIADLHVHTVLSPCASVEMIPPLIVSEAIQRGINLIAITDHNATANVRPVQRAASGTKLNVLPGMELHTKEDVHLLCLFDTIEQLDEWQKYVDDCLPNIENKVDVFGEQFIVDETGDFIRHERRLLSISASIPIDEACRQVSVLGGISIPAHVDRKLYGLFANLGFIPDGLLIDAVEISKHIDPTEALKKFPQLAHYPLIQSGDVHHLSDFLGTTHFLIASPTIAEIKLAFQHKAGREVNIFLKK